MSQIKHKISITRQSAPITRKTMVCWSSWSESCNGIILQAINTPIKHTNTKMLCKHTSNHWKWWMRQLRFRCRANWVASAFNESCSRSTMEAIFSVAAWRSAIYVFTSCINYCCCKYCRRRARQKWISTTPSSARNNGSPTHNDTTRVDYLIISNDSTA